MKYMQLAIEEAKKSAKDVPVGAVIVKNGEIIAKAHNMREINNDVTAHAEMIALKNACIKLKNQRLFDCEMYVTLEPCPMCGWAILQSKMRNLYFGSYDTKYGAFSSVIDLRKVSEDKMNVYGGILEDDCNLLLTDFFKSIR